jgi:hypothetical protein
LDFHVEALQFWGCAEVWLGMARWADLDFGWRAAGEPDDADGLPYLLTTGTLSAPPPLPLPPPPGVRTMEAKV